MSQESSVIFSARDIDYLVQHMSEAELKHELHQAELKLSTAEFWFDDDSKGYYQDYIEAVKMALDCIKENRPKPVTTGKNYIDIEKVKERIDIADVVGRYVTLQQAGKYFKAMCPFHDEKAPSFFVYPYRNYFICYGCQKSGDAIEFIKLIENTDFKGAIQILEGF